MWKLDWFLQKSVMEHVFLNRTGHPCPQFRADGYSLVEPGTGPDWFGLPDRWVDSDHSSLTYVLARISDYFSSEFGASVCSIVFGFTAEFLRGASASNEAMFRNSASLMTPSLRISSKFLRSISSIGASCVLESRNFDRREIAMPHTVNKIRTPSTD